MTPRTFSITAGYKPNMTTFYLRMITVVEENQFLERFSDISDAMNDIQRSEHEYEAMVDALKSWSVKAPTVKGQEESSDPPAEAIEKLFGEHAAENHRIVNAVLARYRQALSPDVSFS